MLILITWWQGNTGHLLLALGPSSSCALPRGNVRKVLELIGHGLLHAAEHQTLARIVGLVVACNARTSWLASVATLVGSRSLITPVPPWTVVTLAIAIALRTLSTTVLISARVLIGLRPTSLRTS